MKTILGFVFYNRTSPHKFSQSRQMWCGGGHDLCVEYGNGRYASVTHEFDKGGGSDPVATVKRLFDRLREAGDYDEGLDPYTEDLATLIPDEPVPNRG